MHLPLTIFTVLLVVRIAAGQSNTMCPQLTRLGSADRNTPLSNRMNTTPDDVLSRLWCLNGSTHIASSTFVTVTLLKPMVVYGISSRGDCRTATGSFVRKFDVSYRNVSHSHEQILKIPMVSMHTQCTQSLLLLCCYYYAAGIHSEQFCSGLLLSHASNINRHSSV